jgi:hypothetical protein
VGAALDKFYVFDMYNDPDTMTVKYRITDKVTGNTAQGTLTTDYQLLIFYYVLNQLEQTE